MKVVKIYPKGFAANSYFVTADGVHAIAIDPSQERVLGEAKRRGLEVGLVLLTHGHFDHVGGVAAFLKEGAKAFCFEKEAALLGSEELSLGYGVEELFHFALDGCLKDGETTEFYGLTIECLATAGHTTGSACYRVFDKSDGSAALFTGDTLFCGTVGRTDLPTGNGEELERSLQKLARLDGDYPVFAGHDEDTSLNEERRNNPYLR